jgi:uncharacterized membrane protein
MFEKLYHMIFSGFSLICHQDPSRSFHFFNKQIPLCARCLGFYVFLIIGSFCLYKYFKYRKFRWLTLGLFLFLSTFSGIEALFEMHFFQTNNFVRFSSGCISGFFLGISLFYYYNKIKERG